jgi:hypothetical protein
MGILLRCLEGGVPALEAGLTDGRGLVTRGSSAPGLARAPMMVVGEGHQLACRQRSRIAAPGAEAGRGALGGRRGAARRRVHSLGGGPRSRRAVGGHAGRLRRGRRVGSLTIQLARCAGATVIGLAGPANRAWLEQHGVIPVTYGDGVADRIREAAPKVDAFSDTYGGDYVGLASTSLAWRRPAWTPSPVSTPCRSPPRPPETSPGRLLAPGNRAHPRQDRPDPLTARCRSPR